LYQTPVAKKSMDLLRDRVWRLIGISKDDARIMVKWFFKTVIPVCILASHGSVERMRLASPLLVWKTLAVTSAGLGAILLVGLAEWYYRIKVKRDLASARRILSWTSAWNWRHGLVGGLKENVPEETLLRGYLVAEVLPVSSSLAYLSSALFTGLGHLYWDRLRVLLSLFIGLVQALLFVATGSLFVPIGIHIGFNLLLTPPSRHLSKQLLDLEEEPQHVDSNQP